MCDRHESHRLEGNCYLCRAVEAAAVDDTQEADT